ncbi:MAG: class II fructose-bisphosphate aldolase [Candidatus Levybacteria bacterium]|nr:class II fructose-bisphosphate aldolase [Candidatus Levybacteria bacterium]
MDKIDVLVHKAVFAESDKEKQQARKKIRKLAKEQNILPASIHNFYTAIGTNTISHNFTVPAINIRALTYDTARVIFSLMIQQNIGPVIFEIARSEIGYTAQRPDEYAIVVLAAAIKEGYKGTVFLQGDHIQFSARRYKEEPQEETEKIIALVDEAIDAQFFNIDIDASTLVDLSKTPFDLQQKANYIVTAALTDHIRKKQPKDMVISIGGEIGHIGGKNSTPEDLVAFMEGYKKLIGQKIGISKISVQTGTTHGGIPLSDGHMAEVKIDFDVIAKIGDLAKTRYKLGGVVQHGASTLPPELFGEFPKHNALEIHLATGFQNIVYDGLPKELLSEMYAWVEENCNNEWEEGWTKEQFIYKLRKKALGPFKKRMWELPSEQKEPIIARLREQFVMLFEKLNVFNTRDLLTLYV